jgi:A/G-specific adenine glycosylase
MAELRKTVREYYEQYGRVLPWRETDDPYRILVSEIMLQQTQVERVTLKYGHFLDRFPDFAALAGADLRDLLTAWQGLGYNRRALALQQTAQLILNRFQGNLPDSAEALVTLPGIGPATAGALLAFVFQQPVVFIETNIRRVFIHRFFPDRDAVKDSEILPLVEKALDRYRVRAWYYALMDYGTMLKGKEPNPNRRSAHYQRQSTFEGSNRQIRGLILKALIERPHMTQAEVAACVDRSPERVGRVVKDLVREGFLVRIGSKLSIASGIG